MKQLSETYHQYAYIQLALEYYLLYEEMAEEPVKQTLTDTKEFVDILDMIHEIVRKLFQGSINGKEAAWIEQLQKKRACITEFVNECISYADAFSLYEHIKNRVEYQFQEEILPDSYRDEQLCKDIMNYIVAEEDQAVIHARIREVIGELPVRMTKNRFLELTKQGIDTYREATKSGLDDFLYRIRTSATLDTSFSQREAFTTLRELYERLQQIPLKDMKHEDYEQMSDILPLATEIIGKMVDKYTQLQKIINYIYALLLTYDNKQTEAENIMVSNQVLQMVSQKFQENTKEAFTEQEEAVLMQMEGRQEQLYDRIIRADGQKDERLIPVEQLISGSLFVDMEQMLQKEQEEPVTKEYFLKQQQMLLEDLEQYFSSHEKRMNRAVMSMVLSQLPVFFHNLTQLQDYIYQSLKQCGDLSEKAAVMELMHSMIND